MVASHSCVAAINPHIRSKPDNVIKAIADTGGYIGICCVPGFLGGSGDITTMMQHIDYVVKKFGFDHVGIGTDVSYTSKYSDEEYEKFGKENPVRPAWESFWPDGSYPDSANPEAVKSMAWTNWPLFTVGMVQMGYSDENIQKILGGNAIRVARASIV
jgi:membrane dipeptidase